MSLAVKRAKAAHSGSLLHKFKGEVRILKDCAHPHLLPLLGYCLSEEAPCLISPLMRGGSLGMRLQPAGANPRSLSLLGLVPPLKPLTWAQRVIRAATNLPVCVPACTCSMLTCAVYCCGRGQVQIMCHATEALVYLHSRHVWHRDVKPDNIFLDENLTAYLADTGFAKDTATNVSGSAKSQSKSRMLYGTDGFVDPSMVNGSESSGSALTDGYAVGVTLLVCLTNRSPVDIFTACEEEADQEFEYIDAVVLADRTAVWPAHAARKVKLLVRSLGSSLCHQSKRKRLKLAEARETLAQLLSDDGMQAASTPTTYVASTVPAVVASVQVAPLQQTALSVQVRQMRKGGTLEGLQRNVSNGFDAAMRRLEAIHSAISGEAETSFEAKINQWHAKCGLGGELRRDLHTLRIWRNASDHHDSG